MHLQEGSMGGLEIKNRITSAQQYRNIQCQEGNSGKLYFHFKF